MLFYHIIWNKWNYVCAFIWIWIYIYIYIYKWIYNYAYYYFKFLEGDPDFLKFSQLGRRNETTNRICYELPGYNWLEEKIRNSATNETTQGKPSTTTAVASSLNEGLPTIIQSNNNKSADTVCHE